MTIINKKFGIKAIDYCFPSLYIDQTELANYLNTDPNKFLVGLNTQQMSILSPNEDIVSLALTAVYRLIRNNNVNPERIGRLEVGTESNYDNSKSIKTHLLALFKNNNSISGCDSVNACYGGTNALLNSIYWLESSFWDGRDAIVVMTDFSMYKYVPAMPTGGGGAIALLLGPDPVYIIKDSFVEHYSVNEFSFMKPVTLFPFSTMNAAESIEHYKNSFTFLYNKYIKNYGINFDYCCLHTPYPKLPIKICQNNGIDIFKVLNSLEIMKKNGNSYTASLYFCFLSLIEKVKISVGNIILMWSFGSGCMSSIFALEKIKEGCLVLNVEEKLMEREKLNVEEHMRRLISEVNIKNVSKDTLNSFIKLKDKFYLDEIVNFKRYYKYNGEMDI